ncbi:MAG: FG-GAP-like repeat-containing protein [Parafilimonas sp.]
MRIRFIIIFILILICVLFFKTSFGQPVIKSFTPASGPVGSSVTITGSGFSTTPANNIVSFGAVNATVNSSTSTILSVTVPAGSNYELITVLTQNLIAYSDKPFIVTFPGAGKVFPPDLFTTRKNFVAGKQPPGNIEYGGNFFINDLNGDGKTDMISTAPNSSKFSVSIFKNISSQGNLSFAVRKDIDSSSDPISLSYGDLNRDGKQDIILNYKSPNSISVLINKSNPDSIIFAPKTDINVSENPGGILIYDIDGDGKVDIAGMSGYNYSTAHVCILRNISSGNILSFASGIDFKTDSYGSMRINDMDGDGKPDIIILSSVYSEDYVYVLRNESTPGNISFGKELKFKTSHGSSDIKIGDLDGDDKPDIALADNQNGTFSILRNTSTNGLISFDKVKNFPVGRLPQGIAIGDIDGDGKPDITVTNNNGTGRTASLYKNLSSPGSLKFADQVEFFTSQAPAKVYAADLDGDGKPEIATMQDVLSICVLLRCTPVEIYNQPFDTTVCSGAKAYFTIKTSNKIAYQWQVNNGKDWVDLINDDVYSGATSDTLNIKNSSDQMNGYQFRCSFVNECGATLYSEYVKLFVTIPSPPSLQINTQNTTVCKGQPVTFTAMPVNGGSNPLYQWQKNNINVGTNANIYKDNALKNGDIISCTLISNASCLSSNTASSNSILMNVTDQIIPQVSILSSDNNVCFKTPVSFTAQTLNAGNAPSYQWTKNGITVGENDSVYTDSTLNNGDTVKCLITSDLNCGISEAISNEIVITIKPLIKPTLSIISSENNICPGKTVNFSAAASNTDLIELYAWTKNGIDMGNNSAFYNDSNINEGDNISCLINLKPEECLVSNIVASNIITMHLLQNLPGPLDLGEDKTLCSGATILINAPEVYISYLWQDGSTNHTLLVTQPGLYNLKVTDACNRLSSDTILITLKNSPSKFLPPDTVVCSYEPIVLNANQDYISYLWNNGSTTSSIIINNPGNYWLQVTDNDNCIGRDSIIVAPKNCIEGIYIPSAFTPNGDGKNDVFKPLVFEQLKAYDFSIFNRLGQMVFHSKTAGKGWDGRLNGILQPQSIFIWICTYQKEGEAPVKKTGTVALVY